MTARTRRTPCGFAGAATDHEPRRRACLAFACLVRRSLRCGDLDIICALMVPRQFKIRRANSGIKQQAMQTAVIDKIRHLLGFLLDDWWVSFVS
jgi:hypothetical protein